MKILSRQFLDVKTKTCHAATMTFHNEVPVFSWFGGVREGASDSSIYLQYGTNSNSSMIFSGREAHWNPVVFNVCGKTYISFKIGEFCDRWQTFISELSFSDEYLNMGNKFAIPAGLNFTVKTKPIVNENKVYCGSSVETKYDWSSYIEEYEYDEENGSFNYTNRSAPLSHKREIIEFTSSYGDTIRSFSKGVIQPSIWVEGDEMHAYMRSSTGLGKIYHSKSDKESGFRDWSIPVKTELDNPNSGIDTVFVDNKKYLVYNPDSFNRYPIVLDCVSKDHKVLDRLVLSENTSRINTYTDELSYPYMVEKDGVIHVVYTYGRSAIEYIQIGL